MALRDQPYLPLYVQDFLTDEKLNLCSLKSQGIYIKIMCILHKSNPYGSILLKQKDKQNRSKSLSNCSSTCLNFAYKFAKLLPIDVNEIAEAVQELTDEGCLTIEGDLLYQKRMVRDNKLSIKRSEAGKKGGKKTAFAQANAQANAQASDQSNAQAKTQANSEYEYEFNNNDNKLLKFLCDKFSVNEIANFDKVRSISQMINYFKNQPEERNNYFRGNVYFYFKYKELAEEKIHKIDSFIGNLQEGYSDGGWNAANWKEEGKKLNLPEMDNFKPPSFRQKHKKQVDNYNLAEIIKQRNKKN